MSKKVFSTIAICAVLVLVGQGCPFMGQDEAPSDNRQQQEQQPQDQTQQPDNETTETEGEPSLSAEQKRQRLIGEWRHVRTEGYANAGPVEYVETWTFNEDGTGGYYRKREGREERTGSFEWRLEEDDIVLINQAGDTRKWYRVDEWSEDEMRWHFYQLENTHIMERQ